MRYFLILLFMFCQNGLAQIIPINKFFILRGADLVFYDGERFTAPITTGITQLCFPLVLKGSDLYNISLKPVVTFQLIARGVTKVFNGSYLIRDRLYSVVNGQSVYLTNGVTEVFNSCPDPFRPRDYQGPGNPSPF